MKNQYEYTINSTEDISRALAEAERRGYALTHYNSAFYLKGTAGEPISVDDSLANLYVVAYGPAPVRVSGKGETTVIAEKSAVVYAFEEGVVDAYDSSTVYAYDYAEVTSSMVATTYARSNDVLVTAYGSSKVFMPAYPINGSMAEVDLESDHAVLQISGQPPYRRTDEPLDGLLPEDLTY